MHISPYARFLAQAYAQFVEASNFCNRKKGKISKRVGKEERMARFCSGQRNTGRASFAAFYAVAEARVAFRQKEGACRSGYVDRKWSVAPRRQLLHGHPYQLFHTWPCGK